jgi:predicted alpha/beta-hydrolase family hydrolase
VPDASGHVEWLREETTANCTERWFRMRGRQGPVPGVVWSPETTVPQATVLLFHGGSGHKRSERHLRMGRRLASAGLAVIAIDGPYHGDRVSAPMTASTYQQLIVDEGIEAVTASMTVDWLDAVSVIAGLGLADSAHVSVFGMSMGVRFGLPAAAALGARLQCAVLGKFGIHQVAPLHPWAPRSKPDGDCRVRRFRPSAVSRSVGRRNLPPGRAVRAVRGAGLGRQATDRQARPARPDASRRRDVMAGLPHAKSATAERSRLRRGFRKTN